MKEGKILDSLKEILLDPDSILNALRQKKERLTKEYQASLASDDVLQQEENLNRLRAEIAKIDLEIKDLLKNSIDSLKRQED